MNTRMILASIITAATLAACSSPNTLITLEDQGPQPTIDQIDADNDSSIDLAGTSGGLGKLVIRKIYDSNQNGKYDSGEAGVPNWGMRITSLYADGTPSQVSDIQVTPGGPQRWRGVVLNVVYGKYTIEELTPVSTNQAGVTWKVTGPASRTVSVTANSSVRGIEFAGACLENGAVVAFPKLRDFYGWKCRANFDLLPRIGSFTAEPNQIQSGGSSALKWNVLDYSSLEITPTVGVVTGFTGSKNVSPSSTTVYTLKATNGFGSRTANVSVNVGTVGSSMKWQTPELLSTTVYASNGPALVRGSNDQALFVIPSIATTGGVNIFANLYTLGKGWGGFERIGNVGLNNAPPAVGAKIATNGDAFAWVANSDQAVTVFRKPNGGTWAVGTRLDFGFQASQFPGPVPATLETDAAGNAFVFATGCLQRVGKFGCNEFASLVTRFTPQSGWSTPTKILPIASVFAVSPNGNAVAVSTDLPTATAAGVIRFVTFTPSTGWSAAQTIDTVPANTALSFPSLRLESSGIATLVWQRGTALCVSTFSPQTINPADCSEGYASIVTGANGVILAMANGTNNIVPTRQYAPGSGWTQPQSLAVTTKDTTDVVDYYFAGVRSVNENNTAFGLLIFVYKSTTPYQTNTTYGLRYTPQTGWQQTGAIWTADSASDFTSTFNIVTFSDGSALAVGERRDASGVLTGLLSNTYR
jgi:hypothetical protein